MKNLFALLYPGTDALSKLNLTFISFENRQKLVHDYLTLLPISVEHKAESQPFGFRIQTMDCSIGYSGDTSWTESLIDIAKDTDLMICECCFFDKKVDGHLSYKQLKEHIHRFECKQVLLTHFDEEMLYAKYMVNYPCAYDGLQLVLQ